MGKRFLSLAGIGAAAGALCAFLIPLAINGFRGPVVNPAAVERLGGAAAAVIVQTVLTALYGVACMGGALFYEIERWPLALATAAHFILIAALYWPLALLLNWTDSVQKILIVNAFQFIGFFIIWLALLLRYKAQVKELNRMQKQNLEEKEKGAK